MAIIEFHHGQQGGTPNPRNPKKITGHNIIRDNGDIITVYDGSVDTETGEVVQLTIAVKLNELAVQDRATGVKNHMYSSTLPAEYESTNTLGKLEKEWAAELYPYMGNQTAQRLIPNVDSYFGLFSFQTPNTRSTTVYVITYDGMLPDGMLLYYPASPETITLTEPELKRFLHSIGYKTGVYRGNLVLNSLMAQAQGRELAQSRGDVELTRTAISVDPIKPNLDIMEEHENADG